MLTVFTQWCAPGAEIIGTPPLVNPIYGKAHKATASDYFSVPSADGRRHENLLELLGAKRQAALPRVPNRTNLLIGNTELWWSGAHKGFGYLYFCLPSGPPIPVWEFASCPKSNLAQVVSNDLATKFVSFSDRTNHSGVGQVVFGTNWLRHSIRVEDGQLILARLARNPAKVYVLQFVEQNQTNAVAYYIETPPVPQVTAPRTGPGHDN